MEIESDGQAVELTTDPTPMSPSRADPFMDSAQELAKEIVAYETVQDSQEYQDQRKHLGRLTSDFALGVRAASLAFTRYPDGKNWLLQSNIDDFLESALSIAMLGRQGVFNVGRRELRYMVETAVKYVCVDQELPGDTPLADRIAMAGDKTRVPRSSVEVVDRLTIRMLVDPETFKDSIRSSFGALSGYVHLSKPQLAERMRRVERGEFSGFESAATLRAFNRLVAQTYDVVLTLLFEGIGPSFTGDLFIQVLDDRPDWKFHKSRFVGQVSAHFDYKAERKRKAGRNG